MRIALFIDLEKGERRAISAWIDALGEVPVADTSWRVTLVGQQGDLATRLPMWRALLPAEVDAVSLERFAVIAATWDDQAVVIGRTCDLHSRKVLASAMETLGDHVDACIVPGHVVRYPYRRTYRRNVGAKGSWDTPAAVVSPLRLVDAWTQWLARSRASGSRRDIKEFFSFAATRATATIVAPEWTVFSRQGRGETWSDASERPHGGVPPELKVIRDAVCCAEIDPAIDPGRLNWPAPAMPQSCIDATWQQGNAELASIIAAPPFVDDVVLMDGLLVGGGQKYQLQVISSLLRQGLSRGALIVCGEKVGPQAWASMAPPGCSVVDLHKLAPHMNEEDRLALVRDLIRTCAPRARVHCKPTRFADGFLRRYAAALGEAQIVYYRWCDTVVDHPLGLYSVPGGTFNIDEFGDRIDLFLCDCEAVLQSDLRRHGAHLPLRVLPAQVKRTEAPIYRNRRAFTKRLLWASRLERQKRVTLLRDIGAALQCRFGDDVVMDVYGTPKHPVDVIELMGGVPNIRYRGPFSSIADIDLNQYDALVYTALYDGMPNVVLEALAAGLPVVCEPVGGLPEVVINDETGLLVQPSRHDSLAARRYVRAIQRLYNSFTCAAAMSENGWQGMANRSQDRYDDRLKEVFVSMSSHDNTGDLPTRVAESDADFEAQALITQQRLEIGRLAEALARARDQALLPPPQPMSNWKRRALKWQRSLRKLRLKIQKKGNVQ